jgi:hypothetical protein
MGVWSAGVRRSRADQGLQGRCPRAGGYADRQLGAGRVGPEQANQTEAFRSESHGVERKGPTIG